MQGRIRGQIYKGYCNGWYRTNDESFLSSSQIMEVENDGQKLVVMVRYYKFIYIGCTGFNSSYVWSMC